MTTTLYIDINWPFIHQALYHQLKKEQFIEVSDIDDKMLEGLFTEELTNEEFSEHLSKNGTSLYYIFESAHDLKQAINFFHHWSDDKKRLFINEYIKQTPDEVKKKQLVLKLFDEFGVEALLLLIPHSYYELFLFQCDAMGDTPIRQAIKKNSMENLRVLIQALSALHEDQQVAYLISLDNNSTLDGHNDLIYASVHCVDAFNLLLTHIQTLSKEAKKTIINCLTRRGSDVLMCAAQNQPILIEPIISLMKEVFTDEEYRYALTRTNLLGLNALIYASDKNEASLLLMLSAMEPLDLEVQTSIIMQKRREDGANVLMRSHAERLIINAMRRLTLDQQRMILSAKDNKGYFVLQSLPMRLLIPILIQKNQKNVALIELFNDEEKDSILSNKEYILDVESEQNAQEIIIKALPKLWNTPTKPINCLKKLPHWSEQSKRELIEWYLNQFISPEEKAVASWQLFIQLDDKSMIRLLPSGYNSVSSLLSLMFSLDQDKQVVLWSQVAIALEYAIHHASEEVPRVLEVIAKLKINQKFGILSQGKGGANALLRNLNLEQIITVFIRPISPISPDDLLALQALEGLPFYPDVIKALAPNLIDRMILECKSWITLSSIIDHPDITLNQLLSVGRWNNEMIKKIIVKNTNSALLKDILDKDFSRFVRYTGPNFSYADDEVIALVVEKTKDVEVINKAVKMLGAGEKTWAKAAAKLDPNSSDALLHIALRSKNPQTIKQCIKPMINDEYVSRSFKVHTECAVAVIENATSSTVLNSLFSKTIIDDALIRNTIQKLATDDKVFRAMQESIASGTCNMMVKSILLEPFRDEWGMRLIQSIDKLRMKALQFHGFNEWNPGKYSEATKAACSLYILLRDATTQYADGKIPKDKLHVIINESINTYRPVLETHRGLKGILNTILNAVVSLINKIPGIKFMDFNLKTQTLIITEDIESVAFNRRPKN